MSETESNLPTTTEEQASNIESSASGKTEPMNLHEADEDHPLAQYAGHTGTLEQTVAQDALGEFLADMIYDSNSAFVREFLQNAETACIRAAKLLLRQHPNYGEDWLNQKLWIRKKDGETIAYGQDKQQILAEYDIADEHLRSMSLPRSIEEVLNAARNVGYDPTINIDLYRDDRKVVVEDNGIGMTTKELDQAYNTVLNSGVRGDSDTGGKIGIGSMTYANMTGLEGKMPGITRTRLPLDHPDVEERDHQPIRFVASLSGVDPLPGDGDVPDDFRGTRFEVPIQDSVNLHEFESWVQEYAEYLRVPVLYQEHENGQNTVNEEYGGQAFLDYHGDAPVEIDRPGEFTVLAGPDIETGYREPDTWLVSMTIDRNTYVTVESFWSVVVQIHDEQGRIVAGPNRGKHVDDVDELHEDDVPTPQPTGDRDRLKNNSNSKRFWNYVADLVKEYELSQISDIAEAMQEADHPADAIRDEPEDWLLFKRMVDYHGGRKTTRNVSRFQDFMEDYEAFPDYDDETTEQVYELFTEVGHAERGSRNPNLKGGRTQKKLGDILSSVPVENVYMGVSINKDLCKVVYNTHDDAAVIAVKNTSSYDDYESKFGFNLLKKVPRKQSDDHDYDVPDDIHARNQRSLESDSSSGKPDNMADRNLKIRGHNKNNQIDRRYTIETFRERLESGKNICGHNYVIAFPRGQDYENISDHYNMQKYASLVSVTQAEYGAINDLDRVFTLEAFKEFSRTTPVQTEHGEMEVQDLFGDDKFPVISYKGENWLDVDDEGYGRRVREQIVEQAIDSPYYRNSENKPDPADVTYVVTDASDWQRMKYGYQEAVKETRTHEHRQVGVIVRFNYTEPDHGGYLDCPRIKSMGEKKLKARTPKWDNDSVVYKWVSKVDSSTYRPMKGILLGFHDAGLDPTEFTQETLREMMSEHAQVGSDEWYAMAEAVTEANFGW